VQFTTTELFTRVRNDAPLEPTGLLPLRASVRLDRAGSDARTLLSHRSTAS